MGALVQFSFNFEHYECARCGMPMVISADFVRRRREDGKNFYCPAGHEQCFQDDELSKLKRELQKVREIAEWRAKQLEQKEKAKSALKGQVTKARNEIKRTKERIGNGACPCCNRSFSDLQRHMHSKHPDYKIDKED